MHVNILKKSLLFFLASLLFQYGLFSQEKQTVRVGYQTGTDLIRDLSNFGKEGIGYEILKKIDSESNFTFEYIETQGDFLDALREGLVDTVGLNFKTAEREKEFLFLPNPFNTVISSLATKGDKKIFYDDPISIDGRTVATYVGNPSNILLDEYLKKNNISVTYLFGTFANYLSLEADYYLTFSTDNRVVGFYTILNLDRTNSYLVFNKSDRALMESIDDVFGNIAVEEGFYVNELLSKYGEKATPLTHRELRRSEVELLQRRPLSVGYIDNHRPYTYTDNEGNANGAIVEILDYFAERYGFTVEYFPYSINSPPEEHSNLDMLISALGNTEYELQYFVPTEEYYSISMVSLVPRARVSDKVSREEIIVGSQNIGMLEYLYTDFDLFLNQFPNHNIIFYATFLDLLNSYEQGKVDLAVFTAAGSTFADAYLEQNAHHLFGADFSLEFRFSISKEIEHEYLSIFNVMFDNLTARNYEDFLTIHTTSFYPRSTLVSLLKDNWAYVALAVLFIVLVFLLYSYKVQGQKRVLLLQAYRGDRLTDLMSSAYFYEKSQEILAQAEPKEFELISFDIDYFRSINSFYSVEAGTRIIKSVAESLRQAFNESTALVARKTAEQFIILRKAQEGLSVEKLYHLFILPHIRNVIDERYKVSLSFGSVIIEDCNISISDIVAQADFARLKGKGSHETTYIAFDSKMKKNFNSKLSITFKMDRAIKDKEFKVYYQPKIDFNTFELAGAEALVRWLPPSGEIIYPDEFIEVFEGNAFISTLDLYVFREVCHFIDKNRQEMEVPIISVNISALTVLEPSLLQQFQTVLDEYHISAQSLELEITESAIIRGEESFLAKVRELKKAGFMVSIDDFGAGVSSLNRLSRIEADVLKLDKAFFEIKGQNEKNSIVVDEVITLAKRLNMKIVAEGVETYEQVLWLKEHNCDFAQGYYFSKAVDETKFTSQLRKKKNYKPEISG